MRKTLTLTLLAATLLLAGPTQAGWIGRDEPMRVTLPPLRVGDRFLYAAPTAQVRAVQA